MEDDAFDLVAWTLIYDEQDDAGSDAEEERLRRLTLQGGCVDRDCPSRLSPISKISKPSRSEVIVDDTSSSSSINNAIQAAALCTGVGDASLVVNRSRLAAVSTVVAISPHQVISADHVKFLDCRYSILADSFCMTLDANVGKAPWKKTSDISFANLKPPSLKEGSHEVMVDPLHGTTYEIVESSALKADFNIWTLDPSGKPGRNHITRFREHMFPASISFFWNVTRTCAMVMYPDVNSFWETFSTHQQKVINVENEKDETTRKQLEKDIRKFKLEFWNKHSGKVLDDLRANNVSGLSSQESLQLKQKLVTKLLGLLSNSWMGGETGSCYVGVGRLLGFNLTAIAHSVSTLPGSSGAALIPTGTFQKNRFVFIGLQSGPAPERLVPLFDHPRFLVGTPDHNIALSCDHPDFVSGYWRNIVPELQLPSKYSASFREETLEPFLHWISLHLRSVVSCMENQDWSDSQKMWLGEGVQYFLVEGNEPEMNKRVVKFIQQSPGILRQLVSSGYPAEEEVENQIRYLRFSANEKAAISLQGWNMPGIVCNSVGELARIAGKLSADSLDEEQRYLRLPLKEFGDCRLVQSGIEISNTRLEVLVHAVALGFRSLFITSGEQILKRALKETSVKRERIQVLVGGWSTTADLRQRIVSMECGYVDVLFVKLSELKHSKGELQACVDSGIVKFLGLQTDSLSELCEALNFFSPTVVQVNLSEGVIPVDILEKCGALNIGVVSTSDLCNMEDDLLEDATLAQLNVVWKFSKGVLPFTAVETQEELSELHDMAFKPVRFRSIASQLRACKN